MFSVCRERGHADEGRANSRKILDCRSRVIFQPRDDFFFGHVVLRNTEHQLVRNGFHMSITARPRVAVDTDDRATGGGRGRGTRHEASVERYVEQSCLNFRPPPRPHKSRFSL